MTDDQHVREIGRLDDGGVAVPLAVGVDHGYVTIGCGAIRWKLNDAAADEFTRLFVSACWQAVAYAEGAP